MHRATESPTGEGGDNLVHVHIGRSARPGLEHVDRELIEERSISDLGRHLRDDAAHGRVDRGNFGERPVDGARGGLDARRGLV